MQPTAMASERNLYQQNVCMGHTLCFPWIRLIDVNYADFCAVNALLELSGHNKTVLK